MMSAGAIAVFIIFVMMLMFMVVVMMTTLAVAMMLMFMIVMATLTVMMMLMFMVMVVMATLTVMMMLMFMLMFVMATLTVMMFMFMMATLAVVMMFMVMLMCLLGKSFEFCLKCRCSFHCIKQLRACELIPRSCYNDCGLVVFLQKLDTLSYLFVAYTLRVTEYDASGIFNLIVEEFSKILHVHFAFFCVNDSCKSV
jgi:hypothetical protein